MRGGIILIVLALLIGYLGVTGRYKCFSLFLACVNNPANCAIGCGGTDSASGVTVEAGRAPGEAPTVYDATTRAPQNFLPPIEAFI